MEVSGPIFSDLTQPGPPKGSFLEGKSPTISGKSRLVKYYSIWPESSGYFGMGLILSWKASFFG